MNGSAVDAAIASCLCVGVINKHSSGIGGGGFMLIYQREKNVKDLRDRFTALDFREKAPGRSKWNMFEYYPYRTGNQVYSNFWQFFWQSQCLLHKKMKFPNKDFFSICDQIRRKRRIWSYLLNSLFMINFIFCAVDSTILIYFFL